MKIIHFSITPLAGAPLRLVNAINASDRHEARLIDVRHYGAEDFGHDVIFSEEKEIAVELALQADIIHLHNYLHYDSEQFSPIDFRALKQKGKLFIRQFHSDPDLVARIMGVTPTELLAQDIPALVVAQFQERKYPDAMVVPNLVPENDPLYMPWIGKTACDIFFSPTLTTGAWDSRWNTKGMPETEKIIADVCAKHRARYKLVHKTPLAKTLGMKRISRIVVDEMITGSYHLSGLEGLSQGKPVLSYLDDRARWIMNHFSGTGGCPFINVRLEDAFAVLDYLLSHPDDAYDIGMEARSFVEKYWPQKNLIKHFEDAYEKLARDPRLIYRQSELRIEKPRTRFFACTLPDLIYRSRKSQNPSVPATKGLALIATPKRS